MWDHPGETTNVAEWALFHSQSDDFLTDLLAMNETGNL